MHHALIKIFDIIVDIGMLECLDRGAGYHYATGVDDAKHSVCTAYVDTYYVRFHGLYVIV